MSRFSANVYFCVNDSYNDDGYTFKNMMIKVKNVFSVLYACLLTLHAFTVNSFYHTLRDESKTLSVIIHATDAVDIRLKIAWNIALLFLSTDTPG